MTAGTAHRTVTLINETGLHVRTAGEVVKLANGYQSTVTVNGVDARSVLGIMALGLGKGAEVEIAAEGDDAQTAVDELAALIESGFGE